LLAIVPPNVFLQRRCPEEVGQQPDGAPAAAPSAVARKTARDSDWTLGSVAKSFPFWCIAAGHLAIGTAVFLINTHLVAHFVSRGVDKLVAAFLFGLIGFTRLGGTLLWGIVSDRLGRDRAYAVATVIAIVGVGCLMAIPADPDMKFVYFAALLYALGHSAGTPTYGAMISDIFSGPRVGAIFGLLEISFGVGSAFGAWYGGYLYDITGSYNWPLALCLGCFALSALAIHACIRWRSRQIAGAH
jgi:MFS family permease